jgi:hypothetical protein
MTIAPVNSTPANPTVIPAWITSWGAFIKAHERLLLIGVGALVLWHYGNKIENIFVQNRLATQSQVNQQLAQQQTENQSLLAQLSQMQTSFNATIANLNAKIAAKQQAVIVQQKIDATLPLPELSAHWESLIASPEGSIVPQPNGTISVSTDVAHSTVSKLEAIPQLTEQVADTQAELKACTDLGVQKDAALVGVKTQLSTEEKARVDDAKVAADKQKHSFWKGFKWGYAAGIGTSILVKIAAVVK